ncbi:hypothetical protein SBI80_06420 [Mycolicibacterium sp. 050158]|nr:hypothetical protein [Mycolicibacterium sp. 050158]MDX1889208.1 hypothetical protein [Mycolicibacterium sp. 050158]
MVALPDAAMIAIDLRLAWRARGTGMLVVRIAHPGRAEPPEDRLQASAGFGVDLAGE